MYGPPGRRSRSSIKSKLLRHAHTMGLFRAGRGLWRRSLTVLNYHRIDDPNRDGFDSFKPNVSATGEEFDRQMGYIATWFNVVSLPDIVAWLDGHKELPPHAALITFDDGYLDNYTTAFPTLRRYQFPALIFLTTGHIGTDAPFYWDLAAYCFSHTGLDHITLPDGSARRFSTQEERDETCKDWVEALKALPEAEKQRWVQRLPDELNVSVPAGYFQGLMMNWDQVREMQKGGIEFGAHTVNHPILTRISLEEVCRQVKDSKSKVEEETSAPVLGFAYPNGQVSDVDPQIEKAVADSGIRAAFTLLSGPSSLVEVRRNPYAIRRIFISHRHTLPMFAALCHPLNRYAFL